MTARRVGTAALILLSLTPFLIIIATRGGRATTVTTGADATLTGITIEPTTAALTLPPDASQSSSTSAGTNSPALSDNGGESIATNDEVGAVVVPLTSTTSLQAPRVTTAGSPTAGPQPTLGPDATTTTVDTINPVTVGICVFSNGAVASGIRESTCQGTFTTDADEARRLSNERRGITTTSTTSTSTTTTSTTTTQPPTTTTTTSTATSTSTTASTSTTSTTQVDPTTTAVDVTPDA